MPDATRVLIVITSDRRRGAELEGTQLASELSSAGFTASVVALASASDPSGIEVPVLGMRRLGWRTLLALRRRAKGVDVVIAYGSSTLPACAISMFGQSTPFVYRSIGDPTAWVRSDWHRRRTGFLIRRARRSLPSGPPQPIRSVTSTTCRENVSTSSRMHAVAGDFGVAGEADRASARRALGLPIDGLAVGCVGSISAEKRIGLAVDAVAELDDAFLLVAGDGPDRALVESSGATQLGERAIFTGVVESIGQVYAAIDVLLLTSTTEGMPGVMIEAALSGVPVVAPDVGAVRWLFDNGVEGELVAADAGALEYSEAVLRTANAIDHDSRRRLDACTWPAVLEQWIAVVRSSAAATAPVEATA